ncbi:MAG: PilZ domain-containing protein [Gammaproteobacteria bacterium]|nr:PilZ domain-containing protein [Gammaproteobacteria bacterium]MDH3469092.1 PilZ domain-containing protein [Gammaproteobacteria bacterium]
MAEERRGHARLLVAVDAKVKPLGNAQWTTCKVKEMSRGGACLSVSETVGGPGDHIEIQLPGQKPEGLVLEAEIVREDMLEYEINAKFLPKNSAQQAEMESLFAVLLSRHGGGRRAHVRIAYRLDVQYGSEAELKGILEDISESGFLMITLDTMLEMNQSVTVVITLPDESLLPFRAQVVRRETISTGSEPANWVGLQFRELDADGKKRIRVSLNRLMSFG